MALTELQLKVIKMKKVLVLTMIFLFGVVGIASADWSVTATWTRSTGPNLNYEECQLDSAVQCTVQEIEPTTCTFVVTDLTGQEVKIRSYNTQGAFIDYVIGTLSPVPVPASNGTLIIVFVP